MVKQIIMLVTAGVPSIDPVAIQFTRYLHVEQHVRRRGQRQRAGNGGVQVLQEVLVNIFDFVPAAGPRQNQFVVCFYKNIKLEPLQGRISDPTLHFQCPGTELSPAPVCEFQEPCAELIWREGST